MTESNKLIPQRNLQPVGVNLQKIAKNLLANQTLLRYLKYTGQDPLSDTLPDVKPSDVFHKNILIIPIIGDRDDSQSLLSIRVVRGEVNAENTEYMEIYFDVEIFVPATQWILKSDSLRPFLIMGEIMESLVGETIEGLGEIVYDAFSLNFITEEMVAYNMLFHFTQFN